MLSTTLHNSLRSTGKTALQRVRQATFSTTRAQAAQQREGRDASRRDADRNAFDITGIQKFQFDDTTSYGHMILEKKREKLELLRAIERDRSLLERKYPGASLAPLLTLARRTTKAFPATFKGTMSSLHHHHRPSHPRRCLSARNSTHAQIRRPLPHLPFAVD